jgi:hypothetical protein
VRADYALQITTIGFDIAALWFNLHQLLHVLTAGHGTERNFARSPPRQKLKASPISPGILSQRQILALAFSTRSVDKRTRAKYGKLTLLDPKRS